MATVAAKRLGQVDDLAHRLAEGRLHYDSPMAAVPDEFEVSTTLPEALRGEMSITGRGWVHRDWRGHKLIRDMAVLSRSICLADWLVDWHLGRDTFQGRSRGQSFRLRRYGHRPGWIFMARRRASGGASVSVVDGAD